MIFCSRVQFKRRNTPSLVCRNVFFAGCLRIRRWFCGYTMMEFSGDPRLEVLGIEISARVHCDSPL